MAKVKVRSFIDKNKIRKLLKIDKKILEDAAKLVVDRIFKNAKTNKRMKFTGGTEKLPTLSPNYIKYRKGATRRGDKTGAFFKKGTKTSQLTYTGQLLDSLEYKINTRNESIEIFFGGVRQDGLKNEEIFEYLKELDPKYNVLVASKQVRKQVLNLVRRELSKKLRRQ